MDGLWPAAAQPALNILLSTKIWLGGPTLGCLRLAICQSINQRVSVGNFRKLRKTCFGLRFVQWYLGLHSVNATSARARGTPP